MPPDSARLLPQAPDREQALAKLPTTHRAIERLMDDGHYLQAARLARQARDAASTDLDRRRYLGLLLFATSRLPATQQVS